MPRMFSLAVYIVEVDLPGLGAVTQLPVSEVWFTFTVNVLLMKAQMCVWQTRAALRVTHCEIALILPCDTGNLTTAKYQYYIKTYKNQEECMRTTDPDNGTENRKSVEKSVIYIVIVLVSTLLVFLMGVIYNRRYYVKNKRVRRKLKESIRLSETRYDEMIRRSPVNDIFEIDSDRVIIFKDQVLGQGAFGKVYKGRIKGLAKTSVYSASKLTSDQEKAENMLVAVKQCYEFADDTAKREFLNEIAIMKEIYYHERLVNIVHCVTQYSHRPISLILEYCEHGDLLKLLQNSKVYLEELQKQQTEPKVFDDRIILFNDVAQIAFEVADGMAYLAEKGYIHRDIAARNIMVTEGKHVKIGDFGLCRCVLYQDDVYKTKGGPLPIKWMAIESLYNYEFSTKSDIWSYGVLLYEVTTLGAQPYADVVPQDGDFRRAMVDHLRAGNRLEQPSSCPDEIYAIMKRTWAEKHQDRSNAAEIRETARKLVAALHDVDGGVYGDRYVDIEAEVNRVEQRDHVSIRF